MLKLFVLVVIAAGLVFGARCITIRKNLAAERQAIDAEWAQVNAALESRAEIVTQLTELVQAEAPAESNAVAELNKARNELANAQGQHDKIQANARLNQAIAHTMLLIENYPKIENSKKYATILEALKNAEFEIAVARRKYNEAVEHYNTRIELFPNNIVASVSRLQKVDAYFQTPAM